MSVKRLISLVMASVLLLGVMALPAAAHDKSDVGVFNGTAGVGKRGTCAKDGTGTVDGAGLGFPLLTEEKKGWWTINTGVAGGLFATVQHPEGLTLVACGRLAPVNLTPKDGVPPDGKLMLGAACGISHGHNGFGEVRGGTPSPHYRLKNLGWLTSAGSVLPVTGDLWRNTPNQGFKKDIKKVGKVLALVDALGGGPCANKGGGTANPTGTKDENVEAKRGATLFTVVGIFAAYKFKGTPGGGPKKGN